jgi:hypothetical protein
MKAVNNAPVVFRNQKQARDLSLIAPTCNRDRPKSNIVSFNTPAIVGCPYIERIVMSVGSGFLDFLETWKQSL